MQYRVPKKPGFLGAVQWRPILFAISSLIGSQVFATEFLAYRFGQLGLTFSDSTPITKVLGLPIYFPLCWVEWCFEYRKWFWDPTAPPHEALMLTAIAGIMGVCLGLMAGRNSFNWRARSLSKDMEDLYGSSRWAKREDIERAGLLGDNKGLLLGGWRERPGGPIEYLYDHSDRPVMICATTRSGKTYSVGIGNALVWDSSMLVVDIKEELYKNTAGFRQKRGHVCVKFCPLAPDEGVRINPLGWIRWETKYEVADAQKFAQEIANPGDEGVDSKHWNDTSTALLDGIVLHEYFKCKLLYKRMVRIDDLSEALSPFRPELPKKLWSQSFKLYLAEMAAFKHDPKGERGWKDKSGKKTLTHPVVREAALTALQRDVEEASGVLSTAKKRFRLYSDPLIREATSECDIEIEDLVDHERPVSLYLVIPPNEQERLSPLVRVVLSMAFARLTEAQVTRRHELLWLLDEFATLGYMRPFSNALSYAAGYGMRFLFIIQNFGQITKPQAYGPYNSIIPNCHIKIFFTVSDFATAKEVSGEIGPQTIQHAQIQFGRTKAHETGRVLAQGAHVQNTKRDLIEPAELMRLDPPEKVGRKVTAPGQCIVTVLGHMPILGVQTFVFFDPRMSEWIQIPPVDQSKALVKRDYVAEVFDA